MKPRLRKGRSAACSTWGYRSFHGHIENLGRTVDGTPLVVVRTRAGERVTVLTTVGCLLEMLCAYPVERAEAERYFADVRPS